MREKLLLLRRGKVPYFALHTRNSRPRFPRVSEIFRTPFEIPLKFLVYGFILVYYFGPPELLPPESTASAWSRDIRGVMQRALQGGQAGAGPDFGACAGQYRELRRKIEAELAAAVERHIVVFGCPFCRQFGLSSSLKWRRLKVLEKSP